MYSRYWRHTDEELLTEVLQSESTTQLEMELANRLRLAIDAQAELCDPPGEPEWFGPLADD